MAGKKSQSVYGYFPKSESCWDGKKGIRGCWGWARAVLWRRETLERHEDSDLAMRWRVVRPRAVDAWLCAAGR